MVSFWEELRVRMSSADSAESRMVLGICFVPAPVLPILHVLELPEFLPLTARDRSKWPRCLLCHGWLPGLSVTPWAASLGTAC